MYIHSRAREQDKSVPPHVSTSLYLLFFFSLVFSFVPYAIIPLRYARYALSLNRSQPSNTNAKEKERNGPRPIMLVGRKDGQCWLLCCPIKVKEETNKKNTIGVERKNK